MEEEIRIAKRLISVCCEEGSLTLLKNTLEKYPYLINEPDQRFLTPLETSLKHGQYEIAHILHSKGADPNSQNKAGQSLLFWAAANNKLKEAQFLLQIGADINLPDSVFFFKIILKERLDTSNCSGSTGT